jgi:hypothetical protein
MRALSKVYGIVALLGLVGSSACLRKDLTHSIYLSPSGVTWSAMERDVRSDHVDPGIRSLEEQDYMLNVRADQHGIARALRSLNATRVVTTVLRRDRPFTVATDGRFVDLASLAQAMLKAAGVRGDASVERKGCEQTFRAWIDVASNTGEGSEALAELMSEATSYRVVLTEGRFLRAEGFDIQEDGTLAIPGTATTPDDEGIVRASLTWSEGWCTQAQTPQLRNAQLHK